MDPLLTIVRFRIWTTHDQIGFIVRNMISLVLIHRMNHTHPYRIRLQCLRSKDYIVHWYNQTINHWLHAFPSDLSLFGHVRKTVHQPLIHTNAPVTWLSSSSVLISTHDIFRKHLVCLLCNIVAQIYIASVGNPFSIIHLPIKWIIWTIHIHTLF